ncbi:MAG: MMPL family transporter [Deltaproteobacteria bacterium]|nr:MMPL family transporter [Deltaproteobacteria bacterium]
MPHDRSGTYEKEHALFARWGRFVYRRRWTVLVASLGLCVLSIVGLLTGGVLANVLSASAESTQALKLMEQELPTPTGHTFSILISSKTLRVDDPVFKAAAEKLLNDVEKDKRVAGVRSPYNTSGIVAPTFMGTGGHVILALVSLGNDPRAATTAFADLKTKLKAPPLEVTTAGEMAVNHDFDVVLKSDLQKVELIALPLALLVLLIVFRSVVASLLPLGVGGLSVLGGIAGIFTLARFYNVTNYSLNVVSMIGLGVAIDYSLFIVSRFREEMADGATIEEAVSVTMATAGRAVLFSGVAVAVGLTGFLFFGAIYLDSIGITGALVVVLAVVYSVTLLPALLAILGPRVDLGRLPFTRRLSTAGLWHRLAEAVMRRPVGVLVPTLVLLGFAAVPFLHIQLWTSDVTMLPKHAEARVAHELQRREFPVHDPMQIIVVARFKDGKPLQRERARALYDVAKKVGSLPNAARLQGVMVPDSRLGRDEQVALLAMPKLMMPDDLKDALDETVGEHIAIFTVTTATTATSEDRATLVRAIRALGPVADGQLMVSGLSAMDVDQGDYIRRRTPLALALVMILTYVALFLLLGSVLLPLKAVLTNIMSLSASFGAIVWIFQDGHLAGVLGFHPAPIEPALPIILFCLVFGLSMDYEVFLLTRVQEEYELHGDTTRAIANGLERSGKLITSAAAIMVVVFAAFLFASVVPIKAVGLGLALAVALDATVIRVMLVPAAMRLLGPLNWWAPGPLARFYRRLGFGGTEENGAGGNGRNGRDGRNGGLVAKGGDGGHGERSARPADQAETPQ